MKTTVKKWALSLLILGLMASCGGDSNSTGGGNNNSNNDNLGNGVSSVSGTENFSGFIAEVDKGNFKGESRDRDFDFREVYTSSNNCEEKWGFLTVCSSSSWNDAESGWFAREINSDGEIYRYGDREVDDFGSTLNEVRSTLVSRMRAASTNKIYKCLDGYNYQPEYCFTRAQWEDIHYDCKEEKYQSGGFSSGGCQAILNQNPLTKKATRYMFEHDDRVYLIDLDKPLGAQPVGIVESNGRMLKYNN